MAQREQKGRGEKQHGMWRQGGQTAEGHICPIKELECYPVGDASGVQVKETLKGFR